MFMGLGEVVYLTARGCAALCVLLVTPREPGVGSSAAKVLGPGHICQPFPGADSASGNREITDSGLCKLTANSLGQWGISKTPAVRFSSGANCKGSVKVLYVLRVDLPGGRPYSRERRDWRSC